MSKLNQIESLYDAYRKEFADKEIVLGAGNVDCSLMLVGEAPGKDEVRLSKPFVGQAGKNLNEFLAVINIEREDIYITNAIKYRLSALNEKTGRVINRPATLDEINQSRSYLFREITIINPRWVVTLGNVPLKSVMGNNRVSIGEVHGNPQSMMMEDQKLSVFPLYHPASIIYNQRLKEVYLQDLMRLKDHIEKG